MQRASIRVQTHGKMESIYYIAVSGTNNEFTGFFCVCVVFVVVAVVVERMLALSKTVVYIHFI